MVNFSYAQTGSLGNIDFEIKNEKLSSALNRLSSISDMNFTYDASDPLFNTVINYQTVDKPPLIILDDLLSNTTHTFKQIGNQFVIYRKKSKLEEPKIEESAKEDIPAIIAAQGIIPAKIIFDTVVVYDTLMVILIDTIQVIDTVFVEKETEVDEIISQDNSSNTIFNPDEAREDGWSATVYFSPILSDFSLAYENKAFNVRNVSLGVEASKNIGKWNFIAGLKFTQFAEKFNHSYSITEGGYYVTDTVDQYYTIVQFDTTWYFVTDTTWKPSDYSEYNYNINNRIGFIELAVFGAYDFYSHKRFNVYGKAGFQMSVLLYRYGIAIPDENKPSGIDFAELKFSSPTFSVLLAVGAKYRLSRHLDFNPELYYFRGFNKALENYPLDKRISGLGIKIGLTYYFTN